MHRLVHDKVTVGDPGEISVNVLVPCIWRGAEFVILALHCRLLETLVKSAWVCQWLHL